MTGDEFARLLSDFTLSAESGDGARFASHFTEDGVYHDYIYGDRTGAGPRSPTCSRTCFTGTPGTTGGRCSIRCATARIGYAWSLSSFTSNGAGIRGPLRRDRRHEPLRAVKDGLISGLQ